MPAADPVPARGRRPRIIAVAAAVVAACLIAAIIIVSDWPGTSSRPRASAAPTAPPTPSASVRWSYDTGYDIGTRPAVAGGTVYVGSDNGNVYALRAP